MILWDGTCALFFFFFFVVTGELSTLRQMMKVPNEPGLSPNNGLENVLLSDQSMASNPHKGQAHAFMCLICYSKSLCCIQNVWRLLLAFAEVFTRGVVRDHKHK